MPLILEPLRPSLHSPRRTYQESQAHEYKLVTEPKLWFCFHALRNESPHTYNISIAKEIYQTIPSFIEQAEALLKALEAEND